MKNTIHEIDEYIENAADFAKPILNHIRELVHEICPDVEEKIKWGMPHFDYKGPMLGIAAFKAHAILGFPKEQLMTDPDNLFKNQDAMGSLGRLTRLSDLPNDKILAKYIKEAMKLNDEGKKVTRPKHDKKELVVPDYFQKALSKNKKVEENFNKMSYSHKKEYLEWITEAKTEVTRQRRIEKALEMIKDAKSRNWKYERR